MIRAAILYLFAVVVGIYALTLFGEPGKSPVILILLSVSVLLAAAADAVLWRHRFYQQYSREYREFRRGQR